MNDWQEHVGVGSTNYALQRTGKTRTRKVVTEEGPHRGTVGGTQTDHKDGRLDAHIQARTIDLKTRSEPL